MTMRLSADFQSRGHRSSRLKGSAAVKIESRLVSGLPFMLPRLKIAKDRVGDRLGECDGFRIRVSAFQREAVVSRRRVADDSPAEKVLAGVQLGTVYSIPLRLAAVGYVDAFRMRRSRASPMRTLELHCLPR